MLLAHRQKQLKYWCEHFKLQQTIKTGYPDLLSTAWLAGFIDAEGCFSILSCKDRRYKSGFRVRYRFCLDQKEGLPLFKHIQATLQSGGYTIEKKQRWYAVMKPPLKGRTVICCYRI
jgi:hypothetical protein